jgi:hypothetical protein
LLFEFINGEAVLTGKAVLVLIVLRQKFAVLTQSAAVFYLLVLYGFI